MNAKVGRRVEIHSDNIFFEFNGLHGITTGENNEHPLMPTLIVKLDDGREKQFPSICCDVIDDSPSGLGRVRITTLHENHPNEGLEGWALGYVVPNDTLEDVYLTRAAMDDGRVFDVSDTIFEPIESDVTGELTRPEIPPITTLDEQEVETHRLALLFELMERNRAEILDVENQIKQEQARIAANMRAQHVELYESQRITAIVYAQHEERLSAGAEALWQAAGSPAKGKTFGAAQIADDWRCVTYDADKALEYARTQIPNLISTSVDDTKFKAAVKSGLLKNVPADVCQWEKGHKIKILTPVLKSELRTDPE